MPTRGYRSRLQFKRGRHGFGHMVTRVLVLLSHIFFVVACSRAELRCPAGAAAVNYRQLDHSQLAVPVRIGQSQPFEFLLDTGSQVTIIEPALAAELHLQPQGSLQVTAVSARSHQIWTSADVVEVGSLTAHPLLIVVEELGQLRAQNPSIRGVLGEDFLTRFDFLIDRNHKTLCLDPGSGMQQETRWDPLESTCRHASLSIL